ncbi:MAG: response regulator [Verrucomicrobiota bacterium]
MKKEWSVLVIDDSSVMHCLANQFLAGSEFTIISDAFNGQEGLEKYKTLSPDIVLLDLIMPKKNGLATLKEIMKLDPHAKVIMFSSFGTGEMIRRCLNKGAGTFLQKPFPQTTLIEHLRNQVAYVEPTTAIQFE